MQSRTETMQPLYDPQAVAPMEAELTNVGVQPLRSAADVDALMAEKTGTTLVVINSVCGCAAGGARPGVALALQNRTIPDRLATAFAGVYREAVERVRSYIPLAPSSPFVALFKDGELIFALERRHIEMMNAQMIAKELAAAFDQYCSAQGPSVSEEEFKRNAHVEQCGSTVPLFRPN
jgi:putative YphP/YqiW family bacilliredoxin